MRFTGLLVAFPLILLGSPAGAQAPAQPFGVPVSPLPAEQPYGAPLLGVQPPITAPGGTLPPPVPPPPSQSHLPAALPAPEPTAATTPFELHPSLTLSETYSDNFLVSSTAKIDNFRSMLTPGLLLGINTPKTRGTVSVNLGVAHDSINRDRDFGYFPSAVVQIKHAFDPRLSLSLVDTFTRSDEPALANQFGLAQERRTFTSNSLGVSADWLLDLLALQGYYRLSTFSSNTDTVAHILGGDIGIPLSPLMALRTGYEHSSVDTSGATRQESEGHVAWASVARQISPFRSVGLMGSYSLQSLSNTRIWNASVFNTFQFAGRLSLSGDIGYSVLTADSGKEFSTVTSHTSATYRFANAFISLAILSDFNQTFLQGQDFGITLTRSYTGTFGYAPTPFIDTALRASYSENTFTGVGNSATRPDSKTLSGTASLTWRLQQWLSLGLDYTYNQYIHGVVPGGVTGGTSSENRAAVRLTASF